MKVKVLKITDRATVFLESVFGKFKANWIGESPVIGSEYFVELDSKCVPAFDDILNPQSST